MKQNIVHVIACCVEAPKMVFQPACRIGERIILVRFVEPDVVQSFPRVMAEVVGTVRNAKIVPKEPAMPHRLIGNKRGEHQK